MTSQWVGVYTGNGEPTGNGGRTADANIEIREKADIDACRKKVLQECRCVQQKQRARALDSNIIHLRTHIAFKNEGYQPCAERAGILSQQKVNEALAFQKAFLPEAPDIVLFCSHRPAEVLWQSGYFTNANAR